MGAAVGAGAGGVNLAPVLAPPMTAVKPAAVASAPARQAASTAQCKSLLHRWTLSRLLFGRGQFLLMLLLRLAVQAVAEVEEFNAFVFMDAPAALTGATSVLRGRSLSTDTATPVADTVACPTGYYRHETIVYDCEPKKGQAYVVVPASAAVEALRVPRGAVNAKISVLRKNETKISVYDPESGSVIGKLMDAESSYALEWNHIKIAGSRGEVSFQGTLRRDVVLRMKMTQSEDASVVPIVYSHDGYVNTSTGKCASHPSGCSRFDDEATRRAVFQWSAWAQSQYGTAQDAWQSLCVSAMEAVSGASDVAFGRRLFAAGPVPFYIWEIVWSKWPDANLTQPGWQATFELIDSLGIKDKYVEEEEFVAAYRLADLYPSMQVWCNSLHQRYGNSTAAYKAMLGDSTNSGVTKAKWTVLWNNFTSPQWLVKASAAATFAYLDTNGNDMFSEAELAALWSTCWNFNGTVPNRPALPTPTPTPAPTVPATPKPTAKAHENAHKVTTVLTKSAAAGAHTLHVESCSGFNVGDTVTLRDEEQHVVKSVDSPHGPILLKTALRHSYAAGAKLSKVEATDERCCKAHTGECLACRAGKTVDEYCDLYKLDSVPGCPTTTTSTLAPGATSTIPLQSSRGACLREDVMFHKAMEGHDRRPAPGGVGECQLRCVKTPGCFRFSYREATAICSLHSDNATWTKAEGFISGPARCVADVRLHVDGVGVFGATAKQRDFLADRFVIDFATAAGLSLFAVRDLDGRPAKVSLQYGTSLIVGARIEVAPGRTIADIAQSLGTPVVRSLVVSSIKSANVTRVKIDAEAIGVTAASLQEAECSVEGTKYAPNMPNSTSEKDRADNVEDCRHRCAQRHGCEHFTFWHAYGGCFLQNGSALPYFDPNTTSGPRKCVALPQHVPEPSDRELAAPGEDPSFVAWVRKRPEILVTVVLVCCALPMVLFGIYCLWRRRSKKRQPRRSRDGEYTRVSTDADGQDYSSLDLRSDGAPSDGALTTDRYAASQGSHQSSSPFLHPEHLGYPVQQTPEHHQHVGHGHHMPWHPHQHLPS